MTPVKIQFNDYKMLRELLTVEKVYRVCWEAMTLFSGVVRLPGLPASQPPSLLASVAVPRDAEYRFYGIYYAVGGFAVPEFDGAGGYRRAG